MTTLQQKFWLPRGCPRFLEFRRPRKRGNFWINVFGGGIKTNTRSPSSSPPEKEFGSGWCCPSKGMTTLALSLLPIWSKKRTIWMFLTCPPWSGIFFTKKTSGHMRRGSKGFSDAKSKMARVFPPTPTAFSGNRRS